MRLPLLARLMNETTDSSERFQPTDPLVLRLSRFAAQVKRIAKGGYNDFHRYAYVSAEDVFDMVRRGLADYGAYLHYDGVIQHSYTRVGKTKAGKDVFHCVLEVRYTLYNVDDPKDLLTTVHVGEATDSEDKAYTKASTSAAKYTLLRMFTLSSGEHDEDLEHPSHSESHADFDPDSLQVGAGAERADRDDIPQVGAAATVGGVGGGGAASHGKSPEIEPRDIPLGDKEQAALADEMVKPLLEAVAKYTAGAKTRVQPGDRPTDEQFALHCLKNTQDWPVQEGDQKGDRIKRIIASLESGEVIYPQGGIFPF